MIQDNRSMIVDHGDHVEHNICLGGACEPPGMDEPITKLYSIKHAEDSGWRYTDDERLLPEPGWICPDCLAAAGKLP